MSEIKIKLVIVGDGAVGKTCMLMSYAKDEFPKEYVPTVFDNYCTEVMVDEKPVFLSLCDTAGQEDYDRLRPISYSDTDVFLVCFSVVDPDTFQNVKEKWIQELKTNAPKVPILLIGTKLDLKTDTEALEKKRVKPIEREKAQELVVAENMYSYTECSALTGKNLKKVFDEAIKAVLKSRAIPQVRKKKGMCRIL